MSGCVLPFLKEDADEKSVKRTRWYWRMILGFGEVSLVGGMRREFDVAIAMGVGYMRV